MVAKLKSITSKIHWSLAAKALLFGFGWLILPFWAFLLFSLCLYLIPLFQPLKLGIPFFITLILAAIETPNGWYAIIFALIFYFIIGIKDLIFIERNSAYEMLVFLIVFAGIFSLFNHFDRWNIPGTLWAPLFFGSCLFFLFKGFFEYMRENKEVVPAIRGKLLAGILAFVFWQISLAVLFLPISPFFQSAIMFLAAFLGIELFSDYTAGGLDRKKILRAFSFFFASIVLIVGIASWSI